MIELFEALMRSFKISIVKQEWMKALKTQLNINNLKLNEYNPKLKKKTLERRKNKK